MVLSEVFPTLYINAKNFKFVSPKISQFCFVTDQKENTGHYFLVNLHTCYSLSGYSPTWHRIKCKGDLECYIEMWKKATIVYFTICVDRLTRRIHIFAVISISINAAVNT
jgi:hypothetical protein